MLHGDPAGQGGDGIPSRVDRAAAGQRHGAHDRRSRLREVAYRLMRHQTRRQMETNPQRMERL